VAALPGRRPSFERARSFPAAGPSQWHRIEAPPVSPRRLGPSIHGRTFETAAGGLQRRPRTRGEATMYVIRETFTAKPGMASKLASLFAETMAGQSQMNTRVLTDFVGPFNTVVMETEVNDLREFEQRLKDHTAKPEIRERMKGYTDLYASGSREIYQVVGVPATTRR
jgi:hypothetical protein